LTSKRVFDVVASTLGLLALSPLLVAIAVLIKLDSKGPVFYRGDRVGKDGRSFRIFKFRTMVPNAESLGGSSTPEDDPRLTRVGKALRRRKLDELPQLMNVLTGDMSFVGPRPQVRWAVDRYTDKEMALLSVRPGITDYASLRFSNEEEILRGAADPDQAYLELIAPEKVRLGLEYVRTRSFWVDMKLICLTLGRVFDGGRQR